MNENLINIAIAIISGLSSVGAWKFYETKIKVQSELDLSPQKANENFIQDLQSRVAKLEALLIESSEEKDTMREKITELSSEISGLKVKLQYLESDNESLRIKLRSKR